MYLGGADGARTGSPIGAHVDAALGVLYYADAAGALFSVPLAALAAAFQASPPGAPVPAEQVGLVAHGLASWAWRPDGACVALVTLQDSIVLVTRDLDPVAEIALGAAPGTAAHTAVSVGWGRTETQFTGAGARALARMGGAAPRPVETAAGEAADDGAVHVAWVGDGSQFAVSFVSGAARARGIRIYDHTGCLLRVAESVPGLDSVLAWR